MINIDVYRIITMVYECLKSKHYLTVKFFYNIDYATILLRMFDDKFSHANVSNVGKQDMLEIDQSSSDMRATNWS